MGVFFTFKTAFLSILLFLASTTLFGGENYSSRTHLSFDFTSYRSQFLKKNLIASPFTDFFKKKKKNDFVEISKKTKEALVNIICIPASSSFFSLHAISGSGVIIDKRGVILTNAHIGQYFLLKDFSKKNFIDCIIRTGSPAKKEFRAEIFYIPSLWISKNAKDIKNSNPVGTGENDFALLLINQRIDPASPLPSSFPFLKIDSKEPEPIGTEVLATGYPAGVLGGIALNRDLYAVSGVVKIKTIQSFDRKNKDFLLLSESSVAERGSSGGAIVNADSNLIGLIVSVRNSGVGLLSELGTLTLSHVNRSMLAATGLSLSSYLDQDLKVALSHFKLFSAPVFFKKYVDALAIKNPSSQKVCCLSQ